MIRHDKWIADGFQLAEVLVGWEVLHDPCVQKLLAQVVPVKVELDECCRAYRWLAWGRFNYPAELWERGKLCPVLEVGREFNDVLGTFKIVRAYFRVDGGSNDPLLPVSL